MEGVIVMRVTANTSNYFGEYLKKIGFRTLHQPSLAVTIPSVLTKKVQEIPVKPEKDTAEKKSKVAVVDTQAEKATPNAEAPISIFGSKVSKIATFEHFFDVARAFARYNGSGDATQEIEANDELRNSDWLFEFGATGEVDLDDKAQHGAYRLMSFNSSPFAMRARYHETTTSDSPMLMVETTDDKLQKQTYLVDVNKVDASNASLIEGFAMLTDAYSKHDDKELIWNILTAFENIVQPLEPLNVQRKTFSFDTRMNFVGGGDEGQQTKNTEPQKPASSVAQSAVLASNQNGNTTFSHPVLLQMRTDTFAAAAKRNRGNILELLDSYKEANKNRYAEESARWRKENVWARSNIYL